MTTLAISIIWWIFLVCLSMGVGAWMLFWWSIRSGQFEDPEDPAAEMLELEARTEARPAPPGELESTETAAAAERADR